MRFSRRRLTPSISTVSSIATSACTCSRTSILRVISSRSRSGAGITLLTLKHISSWACPVSIGWEARRKAYKMVGLPAFRSQTLRSIEVTLRRIRSEYKRTKSFLGSSSVFLTTKLLTSLQSMPLGTLSSISLTTFEIGASGSLYDRYISFQEIIMTILLYCQLS